MSARRIYVVDDGLNPMRFVRAATRSQAIRHVAEDTYEAHVASQEDLVHHLESGRRIEDAGADEPVSDEVPA